MRLINTRVHALFDYAMTLSLLLSPWLFDFSTENKAAYLTAIFCALVTGTLTSLSQMEFSLRRYVSLKVHFTIDTLTGLFLCLSPWLLGFHEQVFKPHFILGLAIVCVALCTDRILSWQAFTVLGKTRKNLRGRQVEKIIRLPEEDIKL